MRKVFLIFTLFLFTCSLFSQTGKGMVWLDKQNGISIDKTPISVSDWTDYVSSTAKEYGSTAVATQEVLPDSILFRKYYGLPFCSKILENGAVYYDGQCAAQHRTIKNSPMVGISYKQAVQYCRWRSSIANKQEKLVYSLPSAEVYNKARLSGNKKILFNADIKEFELNNENSFDYRIEKIGFRCMAVVKKR